MPDTLVVTSPHYRTYVAGNVDVSLLFGELEKNVDGVRVAPFSLESAAAGAYDVIHVYWREWVITRDRGILAARRSAEAVLTALTSARRRGAQIVWDANNEQFWVLTDAHIDVLATTAFPADDLHDRPAVMPAVWARPDGAGGVFVSTIGHKPDDFDVPHVRTLTERGLLWASW